MKKIAFALVLLAPVLTQAQEDPAPVTRDQVCFAWLSDPPPTVAKLVAREVADSLKKIGAARRGRVLACLNGAVQALQPEVRTQCLTGADPAAVIFAQLAPTLELCIEQSGAKPVNVIPAPPETTPEP